MRSFTSFARVAYLSRAKQTICSDINVFLNLRGMFVILHFFFFQAEDGIRDYKVTGVQTCALPICRSSGSAGPPRHLPAAGAACAVRAPAGLSAGAGHCPPAGACAALCLYRRRPAGDRKSVVWGKSVDLGGRRIIKKKKKKGER